MKTLFVPPSPSSSCCPSSPASSIRCVVTGIAKVAFPDAGRRQPDRQGRQAGRLGADRPELHRPEVLLGPAVGHRAACPTTPRASGGSNQGPLNPALVDAVKGRIEALHAADPDNTLPIPVDLVTASASGLDPHISPAAAAYQVGARRQPRHLPPADVKALVSQHTEGRQWGIFGEPRVNVLQLNLALDSLHH